MVARSKAKAAADGKKQANFRKNAKTAPQRKKALLNLDQGDITGFLEDLDVKLEEKCSMMRFEAMRRTDELKNAYKNSIFKLPKSIRRMPIKVFCEKYGGDIKLVLEDERLRVLQSTGFSSASPGQQPQPSSVVLNSARAISKTMSMRKARGQLTSSKKTNANDLRSRAAAGAFSQQKNAKPKFFLGTPGRAQPLAEKSQTAGQTLDSRLPETPAHQISQPGTRAARPLRRGESLMSVNGSPIVGDSLSTSIALAIGHDPSKINQEELTDEDKERTRKALQELQSQVSSLMEHLKP